MRLIDADALLQEFETENVAHNSDLWHITGIKAFIENQPTAYVPEKVVTELEEKSDDIPVQYEDNYEKGFDDGIGYAIEIVRKGGV